MSRVFPGARTFQPRTKSVFVSMGLLIAIPSSSTRSGMSDPSEFGQLHQSSGAPSAGHQSASPANQPPHFPAAGGVPMAHGNPGDAAFRNYPRGNVPAQQAQPGTLPAPLNAGPSSFSTYSQAFPGYPPGALPQYQGGYLPGPQQVHGPDMARGGNWPQPDQYPALHQNYPPYDSAGSQYSRQPYNEYPPPLPGQMPYPAGSAARARGGQEAYVQPGFPHDSRMSNQEHLPGSSNFEVADYPTEARKIFMTVDVRGDGCLDPRQFLEALRSIHLRLNYPEATRLFGSVDRNQDGRITEEEFIDLYCDMKRRNIIPNRP